MSQRITAASFARDKFYQLPKVLFTDPNYRKLSSNAKIIYAILKDRMELSIKNNYVNEKGEVYFTFDEDKLSELSGISKKTIYTVRTKLEEFGLLEIEYTGRANIYFLLHPKVTQEAIEKTFENDSYEQNTTSAERDEKGRFISGNSRSVIFTDHDDSEILAENEVSETAENSDSSQIRKNYQSDPQNLLASETDSSNTEEEEVNKQTHPREVTKIDQYLCLVEYYLQRHNVPAVEIDYVIKRLEKSPDLIQGEAIQNQMDYMLQKIKTDKIYRFGQYFIEGLIVNVANLNIKRDEQSVISLRQCLKVDETEPLPKVSLYNWIDGKDPE